MSRTSLEARRHHGVPSASADRVLVARGSDDVTALYQRAYPDHEVLPTGSESRFAAWLLATHGRMPEPGERLTIPPYEDMLAGADLASREVHDRARELFRSGITCTGRAQIRARHAREKVALTADPARGLRGPTVSGPRAGAGVREVPHPWPARPQPLDPQLARLVETLADQPEGPDHPQRMARGLVDALSREGVDNALEALAKRLGLPESLGTAAGRALHICSALFGDALSPSQVLVASRELERLSSARPEHFAPVTRHQIEALERALSRLRGPLVAGRGMTPVYFREQVAALFGNGGLQLADLRGFGQDAFARLCGAMLAKGSPELSDEEIRELAEQVARAIEDAVGRRFFFEAITEARQRLEDIARTLRTLGTPDHLRSLAQTLRAAPVATRREILTALGMPSDTPPDPAVLADTLTALVERALAHRDALLDQSKGPELLVESYPQAVLAVAARLGLQLDDDGGLVASDLGPTLLEAGVRGYRGRAAAIRGVVGVVTALATAPFGEMFSGRLCRYLVAPALESAPELLDWVAREATR